MVESNDKLDDKPTLRLGAYHHAMAMEMLADSPLGLERNRDGIYYWSMARAGEYHFRGLHTTSLST